MPAETLNCPMCGAAASSDAPQCEHCGARLATVACPKCFGMMFTGAKFCSHCGAGADRTELAAESHEMCPRCRIPMEAVLIGKANLEECPRCEGVWANTASVKQICEDTEEQTAVLGQAGSIPAPEDHDIEAIHYVPCPVCKEIMNRVNFANCSHVVVNVCRQHGTWFDKDQLRQIVAFIRAGGFERARRIQIEELEEKESAERIRQATPGMISPDETELWSESHQRLGIFSVAEMIKDLLDL